MEKRMESRRHKLMNNVRSFVSENWFFIQTQLCERWKYMNSWYGNSVRASFLTGNIFAIGGVKMEKWRMQQYSNGIFFHLFAGLSTFYNHKCPTHVQIHMKRLINITIQTYFLSSARRTILQITSKNKFDYYHGPLCVFTHSAELCPRERGEEEVHAVCGNARTKYNGDRPSSIYFLPRVSSREIKWKMSVLLFDTCSCYVAAKMSVGEKKMMWKHSCERFRD